jgi:hypothetical protein
VCHHFAAQWLEFTASSPCSEIARLTTNQGVLTLLTQCFHDKSEVDEGDEREFELVEATEGAAIAFESSEGYLDLVAAPR